MDKCVRLTCFCIALLGLAVAGAPALADSVSIPASKDNTLFETFDDNSSGAGINLFAGQTCVFGSRRALLAFDIAGSVPAGATIDAVTLSLTSEKSGPLAASTDLFSLHRLTQDWGEAGSDSGAIGSGAAAQPGDATWAWRFFATDPWTTPGGDIDASASGTGSFDVAGAGAWGPEPGMTADVQGWLDGPATNFGWALLGPEGSICTAQLLASREGPENQPELTIEFTPGGGVDPTIPTLGEWGIIVMTILLLAAGAWIFRRQQASLSV
jgi:hypothetical protein